jgi:hypothetical protein
MSRNLPARPNLEHLRTPQRPGPNGFCHFPMKAQVARSKTRLRFIFALKAKSKLSSVLFGSRKAACLRRLSNSRSLAWSVRP